MENNEQKINFDEMDFNNLSTGKNEKTQPLKYPDLNFGELQAEEDNNYSPIGSPEKASNIFVIIAVLFFAISSIGFFYDEIWTHNPKISLLLFAFLCIAMIGKTTRTFPLPKILHSIITLAVVTFWFVFNLFTISGYYPHSTSALIIMICFLLSVAATQIFELCNLPFGKWLSFGINIFFAVTITIIYLISYNFLPNLRHLGYYSIILNYSFFLIGMALSKLTEKN